MVLRRTFPSIGILALLVLVGESCRGLHIQDDRLRCGPHGECPAPYGCDPESRCSLHPTSVGDGSSDGETSDAGAHDAPAANDTVIDATQDAEAAQGADGAPDATIEDSSPDPTDGAPQEAASEVAAERADALDADAPVERAPVVQGDAAEVPPIKTHVVSVLIAGPANTGSVLSTTAGVGINCGATCSAIVEDGAQIQLTASPSAQGTFSSWASCTTMTGSLCSLTVTKDVTITATFKLRLGAACARAEDCETAFCVSNVCCVSACNGTCDASCQGGTGACLPKPLKTPCGSLPGPSSSSGISDVSLFCDAARSCVAPTIRCASDAGDVSCNLTAKACCNLPFDGSGTHGRGCVAPSACAGVDEGDNFNGHSCTGAGDCPLMRVCCSRSLANGGRWAACASACDDIGAVVLP
jgi:hypothetical protein